jgi:hypothetical protein
VPGAQPKEGIGFELLVAAELKSATQATSYGPLDLQRFLFNVNPVDYPGTITGAPYDASVDITAIGEGISYLIECKSSKDPVVLKPKTRQFLEAILEFLALQLFKENSKWNYRYILAVNYPIGSEIKSLIQNRTEIEVRRLSDSIVKEGGSKYGERFDPAFVTIPRLAAILANLSILEFPDRYLKTRSSTDESFRKAHEMLSNQLRPQDPRSVGSIGGAIAERYGRVTIGCSTESSHADCDELVVNGTLCHMKNPQTLITRLLEESRSKHFNALVVIGKDERGFTMSDISWSNDLSSESVAEVLTDCFNTYAKLRGESDLLFYVLPGFFDVIILSRSVLAPRIRESLSALTGQYMLDSVTELRGLGDHVKVELSRLILSETYGVRTTREVFESHEETIES